jgi:L-alanine-DL-glutamate epimerase-like enolase superfamily enzyme
MAVPRVVAVVPHVVRTDVPRDWSEPTASFVSDGALLLEVTTDAGLVGWGEPSPYGAPVPALLDALRSVAPALVGAEIESLPSLLGAVATEGVHAYGRAARSAVVAGLSQAVWDLRGHVAGRPTYELLAEAMGTPAPSSGVSIEAYASAGMFFADAPDEDMVEEAIALRGRGFRAYKLRPPTPRGSGSHFARVAAPPPFDVDALVLRCAAVRDAVPDLTLMLDVGRRIPDVATAARLAQKLGALGFRMLEEPVAGGLADHQELRRRTEVPIAGGEQFVDADELERWLGSGALDVVQPDAGLAGLDAIVELVRRDPERTRRALVPHSWTNPVCTAANVHVAVAAGATLIEANETFNPMRIELLEAPYLPVGGRITVEGRPGLGVTVDRDALARFSR